MTVSIPANPTLSIAVGDSINYKGKQYAITAVAAGSDNGKGITTYAVTISQGILTCSANDTVMSSANNSGVAVWDQSVVS